MIQHTFGLLVKLGSGYGAWFMLLAYALRSHLFRAGLVCHCRERNELCDVDVLPWHRHPVRMLAMSLGADDLQVLLRKRSLQLSIEIMLIVSGLWTIYLVSAHGSI